ISTPDQETLLRAVEDARRILGEYIEPGQRDAGRTVQRLLAVLDTNDVVHALDRMKRRRVMHWSNDHLPEASQGRLLRTRRSRSILQHCPQRYLMRSSPSPSGAIVSSFIVLAQTIQEMSVTSGLWSSLDMIHAFIRRERRALSHRWLPMAGGDRPSMRPEFQE